MVYLFITKNNTVEHYTDKEEAQRLFNYGEPDKVITDEEFYNADNLVRLIDGEIFLGKTDEEKKKDKALEVRTIRDKYLKDTDVYLLSDFPNTETQLKEVKEYRQMLRDLPTQKDFPFIEIPVYIRGE